MSGVDDPNAQQNQEANALGMNDDLRQVLSTAVGVVQGRQLADSFYAVTYEELADQQIERISGKSTTTRPNELERVAKIEQDILSLVAQVRNIPPEKFLESNTATDVNTPTTPRAS